VVTDDEPSVPIRILLRPSTYRAFDRTAHRLGLPDVATLLSRLADRSVERDRIDARIRELNAQQWSDNRIAKELGIAQSSISRRRRRLGIQSATPRPAGSGRRRSEPVQP
jgi:transcriptional regulator with GAF, ATPase, and Fis domain